MVLEIVALVSRKTGETLQAKIRFDQFRSSLTLSFRLEVSLIPATLTFGNHRFAMV